MKLRPMYVKLLVLVLVLSFTAVAAFAQATPVPPPTSDELVASTFSGMTEHFPIAPIAAIATLIIGLIVWISRRMAKWGR